jgi:hypothetical protein
VKFIVLLIVGLGAAFGLYRCMPSAKAPTPAVVVQEAHEAFPAPPKAPEAPYSITPSDPRVKLKTPAVPKRAKVLPRTVKKKHVERFAPSPAPVFVPEEPFIPKCLFWFFGEFGCKSN